MRKYMTIGFTNDEHLTFVEKRCKIRADWKVTLSENQLANIRRALCPKRGCACDLFEGSYFSVRKEKGTDENIVYFKKRPFKLGKAYRERTI